MDGSSVIGDLHLIDQDLTLLINSWSSPWTDGFWMMMSDKSFWIPTYIICAFFLFKRLGWKKALVVIASCGLAFALCDQFSNIVKHAVVRLRPSYSSRMLRDGLNILERRGGFYGFFSAHAANTFATAMCLIIGFRNDKTHTYNAFRFWALMWAALVSLSRVFVGKHYFGDILVGTAVGLTIGYLAAVTARYLNDRFFGKEPTVQAESSPSGFPSTP
ncbi:MAG: phosphatase PAP2 family protein [Bacteroidales bacterium]|nr:phosphatase PAP2 family protein [Bacteroidales bacterium]